MPTLRRSLFLAFARSPAAVKCHKHGENDGDSTRRGGNDGAMSDTGQLRTGHVIGEMDSHHDLPSTRSGLSRP